MKARIRHTSKIVDVIPHGEGWDYKENKEGTDYECFMAQDLDFENIEGCRSVSITAGTRHLKDITDAELAMIVDISHCYGAKEYWGEAKVTDIDRNMFSETICIDYEQTRIRDGAKATATMFFNINELSYHVHYIEPYDRSTETLSVCANTQMFLWLIAQGFNLLELLTYAPIYRPRGKRTYKTVGFLASKGYTGHIDLDTAKFFSPDSRQEATDYIGQMKQEHKRFRLFRLIDDIKETEE